MVKATRDEDWYVRQSAAIALGQIKDPRAVEPLIAVLLGDKNPDARQYAARSLGEIKDPRAVEPLRPEERRVGRECSSSAALALGQIKDPRAVEP